MPIKYVAKTEKNTILPLSCRYYGVTAAKRGF
jgi:hypothetical protein